MNNRLEKVKQFHEMFNHEIGENSSCFESLKTRQLRIKLLFEELTELAEASDCMETMTKLCEKVVDEQSDENLCDGEIKTIYFNPDGDNVNKKEELDALCDIEFVLNGKILTSGLHNIFDREYKVVYQNNMTKAHDSNVEAIKTLGHVLNSQGDIVEKEGKFLVYNKDGKLIKPYNHKKVELNLEE